MRHEEFRKLPFLLADWQVSGVMGYAGATLGKMVACGNLEVVQPAGSGRRRFRKVQVAQLAGLEWEGEAEEFGKEPLMMGLKGVVRWTGYAEKTVGKIARGGGLVLVRPAGLVEGKFRKVEVAALLGLDKYV